MVTPGAIAVMVSTAIHFVARPCMYSLNGDHMESNTIKTSFLFICTTICNLDINLALAPCKFPSSKKEQRH
jgi:hypothetical protein